MPNLSSIHCTRWLELKLELDRWTPRKNDKLMSQLVSLKERKSCRELLREELTRVINVHKVLTQEALQRDQQRRGVEEMGDAYKRSNVKAIHEINVAAGEH